MFTNVHCRDCQLLPSQAIREQAINEKTPNNNNKCLGNLLAVHVHVKDYSFSSFHRETKMAFSCFVLGPSDVLLSAAKYTFSLQCS